MPVHELAALGSSLCFAVAGVLAIKPSRVFEAIRFNRIRMLIMAVGLFCVAMVSGALPTLIAESLPVALLSGLVEIFLDNTFLSAGLRRVRPRLNAMMVASNAPLTVVADIFS